MGTASSAITALRAAAVAVGLEWDPTWVTCGPWRVTARGVVALTFGGVDPLQHDLLCEGWRDAARSDRAALDLVEALDAYRRPRGLGVDVGAPRRARVAS